MEIFTYMVTGITIVLFILKVVVRQHNLLFLDVKHLNFIIDNLNFPCYNQVSNEGGKNHERLF